MRQANGNGKKKKKKLTSQAIQRKLSVGPTTRSRSSEVALIISCLVFCMCSGNFGKSTGPSKSKLGYGVLVSLQYKSNFSVSLEMIWARATMFETGSCFSVTLLLLLLLLPPLLAAALMLEGDMPIMYWKFRQIGSDVEFPIGGMRVVCRDSCAQRFVCCGQQLKPELWVTFSSLVLHSFPLWWRGRSTYRLAYIMQASYVSDSAKASSKKKVRKEGERVWSFLQRKSYTVFRINLFHLNKTK